jgi:hypothetical protein
MPTSIEDALRHFEDEERPERPAPPPFDPEAVAEPTREPAARRYAPEEIAAEQFRLHDVLSKPEPGATKVSDGLVISLAMRIYHEAATTSASIGRSA